MYIDWTGCYKLGWRKAGLIPDAFAHPAKFAPGLIDRIFQHGKDRGWWKDGDVIGDCFGGVGGGGMMAAPHGLRWVGLELEPMFYQIGGEGWECPGTEDLPDDAQSLSWPICDGCRKAFRRGVRGGPHHAKGNIETHRSSWAEFGLPEPVLVLGDSRRFASVVRETLDGIVTSAPYQNQGESNKAWGRNGVWGDGTDSMGRMKADYKHGITDGNVGTLKPGDLDAVVTSSPYSNGVVRDRQPEKEEARAAAKGSTGGWGGCTGAWAGYGKTEGQVADLPEGEVDAVVTSAPYAETRFDGGKTQDGTFDYRPGGTRYGHTDGQLADLKEGDVDGVVTSPPWETMVQCHGGPAHQSGGELHADYGDSDGQVGNESAETYWAAMRDIYAQCLLAIRPGGVLCSVIKDYVKAGQRVRLCDDTWRLLLALGFEPVERIRAWQVEETVQHGLFGKVTQTKSHKGFFRRNHEDKVQAALHWELLDAAGQQRFIDAEDKLVAAQKAAWEAAGKPPQETDLKIDYEEVLVVRTPERT